MRNVLLRAWTILVVERRLPWFVSRRLHWSYWIGLVTQLAFKLVYLTRPVVSDETSDTEVITLCGARALTQYLVAIKTLLFQMPIRAAVTVISDGSIDSAAEKVLRAHVRGIRIVGKQAPDLSRYTDVQMLLQVRRQYVFSRKILDMPLDVRERILIFDSDVLVRQPLPSDMFDLSHVKIRFNRDHDHATHDAHFHLVDEYLRDRVCVTRLHDLNSGFIILDRCVLDPSVIESFFGMLFRKGNVHPVSEQDCFNVLGSLWESEPLPDTFMVGSRSWERAARRDAVSLHFIGAVRYRGWSYLLNGMRCLLLYTWTRQPHMRVDTLREGATRETEQSTR